MKNIIKINHQSVVPKYKQIVHSVQTAIENGQFAQGDILPSLNQIRDDLQVSRDTVIKAYNELRALGLISSSPGKGNFITGSHVKRERNIFLLFDNFDVYKEILYSNIETTLSGHGILDVYFHHYKETVFFDLLNKSKGKYTDYIIVPLSTRASFDQFMSLYKDENIFILDRAEAPFHKVFPSVYQTFDTNIYQGMQQGLELLKKYTQIKMILGVPKNPSIKAMLAKMRKGFRQFCSEHSFKHEIIPNVQNIQLEKGMCFLVHRDDELVELSKRLETEQLVLGQDVGIISFNDTPLKEIAAGGITTITTDFELMGKTIAKMVLSRKKEHIQNPVRFIQRRSL